MYRTPNEMAITPFWVQEQKKKKNATWNISEQD